MLEDHLVAYIDLLGFSQEIASLSKSKEILRLLEFVSALERNAALTELGPLDRLGSSWTPKGLL